MELSCIAENLKAKIRSIPDFPKPGILFRDITTLLKDKEAFRQAVDIFCQRYKGEGIDAIVAVESRGFILGGAVAYGIGAGFVPVRKKGKLPAETYIAEYELEYGTDALEIHKDALKPGDRVVILDDLLATGGTASAVIELVEEKLGGVVHEVAFLIELTDLNGREKLGGKNVFTVIKF